MGATNETGNNITWFKLKEDKGETSDSKGLMRFFKKEKVNGEWVETEKYRGVTGFLEKVEVKEYQYEGKAKKELTLYFQDDDPAGGPFVVHLGLDTTIAKNILNSLASIEEFGVISLTAGGTKEYKGKYYPTLYVNNNGEKTAWRFGKEEIPPVAVEEIEGQQIKRGVAANVAFWERVANDLNGPIQYKRAEAIRRQQGAGNAPAAPQTGNPDPNPSANIFSRKIAENEATRQFYQNNAGNAPQTGGAAAESADDLPF